MNSENSWVQPEWQARSYGERSRTVPPAVPRKFVLEQKKTKNLAVLQSGVHCGKHGCESSNVCW